MLMLCSTGLERSDWHQLRPKKRRHGLMKYLTRGICVLTRETLDWMRFLTLGLAAASAPLARSPTAPRHHESGRIFGAEQFRGSVRAKYVTISSRQRANELPKRATKIVPCASCPVAPSCLP